MDAASRSPYLILNIPETASREEIDAAYSGLMSRFSEENYLGSPLWDMAAEKRQEIQSAYQHLNGVTEKAKPQLLPSEQAVSPSICCRVRDLLNRGDLEEAHALLTAQPDWDSDPELLYLRGILAWKHGWMDEASQLVRRAADAVPTNQEYQNALEKFCAKPKPFSRPNGEKGSFCSRFESAACITECCCECFCEGICDSIDC